jgi:hypothetical protein
MLATAIGRFSGWRYDLPADWVPYFYFGIGFVELIAGGAFLLGLKPNFDDQQESTRSGECQEAGSDVHRQRRAGQIAGLLKIVSTAIFFALLGGLPWLAELPAVARFSDQSRLTLEARLHTVLDSHASREVEAFLVQPEAVLAEGRLLYPRYFHRGAGMPSANSWPAYAVRDYPRTGFQLLNATLVDVLLPAREAQPLPHAARVLVLGCQREGYIEARLAAFPETVELFISDLRFEPCANP